MEMDPSMQKPTHFTDRQLFIFRKDQLVVIRARNMDWFHCQYILKQEHARNSYGCGDGGSTLQAKAKLAAALLVYFPQPLYRYAKR